MKAPDRYDPRARSVGGPWKMVKCKDGPYVDFEQHQEIVAALAAEVEHLKTRPTLANQYAEYATLAAENERLRKAGEWQPIGTAPKDGTHILTCGDGYIVVAMWFVYHGGRSQWETVDGESEIDPTHWMPLPAAPAAKEGRDAK